MSNLKDAGAAGPAWRPQADIPPASMAEPLFNGRGHTLTPGDCSNDRVIGACNTIPLINLDRIIHFSGV